MSYNPFSLEGKTILVTGASSGIGRQTAIECSKMGAKVIICGRNQERLNETLSLMAGEGHITFVGDLLDENIIKQLIQEIPDVDGTVLAAGRGLTMPVLFSTREKFDEIFNINFFSNVELMRLLVKKKKIKAQGSIIFIVSVGGTLCYTPGNAVYGASKSALNSMIHFAAIELASKKIRVNGISPGMIDTPLIHNSMTMVSEEQLKIDAEKYPLKRYGKPQDVAMGAIYLLSEASSWVTGQSLVIDGGISSN